MLRIIITLSTLLLTVMCTGQKPNDMTKEFTNDEFDKHYEFLEFISTF